MTDTAIRIASMNKFYGNFHALKGIDLQIAKGEKVVICGPSGSGKSTLIRCINRLVEPTSGKVYLGNVELTRLSSSGLRRERRRMGMIFQEYALVERLTVMENVLSGRLGYVGFWRSYLRKFPQSDVDEAFRLLDRVDLAHMADKRADELSGGQRQSVAIARAVVGDPQILLFDELTSAMDNQTESTVVDRIREFSKNKTMIISTHRASLLSLVDRIVVMDDGRVIADGPKDKVLDALKRGLIKTGSPESFTGQS